MHGRRSERHSPPLPLATSQERRFFSFQRALQRASCAAGRWLYRLSFLVRASADKFSFFHSTCAGHARELVCFLPCTKIISVVSAFVDVSGPSRTGQSGNAKFEKDNGYSRDRLISVAVFTCRTLLGGAVEQVVS